MKWRKNANINKGAPSGFFVSLVFHVAAFFIAGLFVVFRVMNPPEPEFEAPAPIERPKMKLKKPKVKVKKSSQPKPSSRIVAKVRTKNMPEIQLPDLVGSGDGLLGGLGVGGEFLDLPEIPTTSLFGGGTTSGSDMEVSFYCMARERDGTPNYVMSVQQYCQILRDFVKDGWSANDFSRYYRSPQNLYSSTILIPPVNSLLGPAAFNENMEFAYCWVAHYRGRLVHKDDITFRFWGASDDVLVVAVDGEVVLAANLTWDGIDAHTIAQDWTSKAPNNRVYRFGGQLMAGSDWITLKAGEAHDLQAIVGEAPGGAFYAALLVEVQGVDYPLNYRGDPIFPAFTTEKISRALQDEVMMNLLEEEANVTNVTTIFNDL